MIPTQACQVIATALIAMAPGSGKTPGGAPRARKVIVSYRAPAWSQDGRRIAFIRERRDARPQIVIADAAGRNPTLHTARPLVNPQPGSGLSDNGSSHFSSLRWSPDGRKLAFIERRLLNFGSAYPADRLCVLSADGRHFRGIKLPTAEIGALAWSPDGRRIAVAANENVFLPGDVKERRADIWVAEAASGRARKLARSPGDVTFLSWSPDGQHLVFTSRPEWDRKRATVLLIRVDGRRRAVLSHAPADTFFADWSPSGSRLVYTARGARDTVVLEVVRSSGRGKRVVWRCPSQHKLLGVSWPARGSILTAVMAGIARPHSGKPPLLLEVDAIDPRTGRSRVMARIRQYPDHIAWSHNGRFIAYEGSSRGRASEIYRLDIRSGRVKRLTRAADR